MEILLPDFIRLLSTFNKHKVGYVIIGGYAVIFHGYERLTTDIDLLIEPTQENKTRIIAALKDFGIDKLFLKEIESSHFSDAHVFSFGEPPRKIDLLTKINHVNYDTAIPKINYFTIDNEQIPVIGYHDLILSKMTNDRGKDKGDVEELQRIHNYKFKNEQVSFIERIKKWIFK